MAMATASSAEPSASCEAPLKPTQPSQRMKVPSVASGRLAPGIGCTAPSGPYLPLRGPRISAPVKAAQPPTEWTMVEPAKSEKPASVSQPPPPVPEDRQSVVSGKSVSVRVDLGGRRLLKKKNNT